MPTISVDDPADPRVAVYLGLRDHQVRIERERTDPRLKPVFLTEGERLISMALDAGLEPISMLRDADRATAVETRMGDDVPIYLAGPEVAFRLTGMHIHRGALAAFARPPERTLGDLLDSLPTTLLVAERVINPTNLGVMTRSAAGLGMDGLVVDAESCDPLYRRAYRVAMGASLRFPWARVGHLAPTLAELKARGFTVVAMALSEEAIELDRAPFGERVALVMGNEFTGLSDETLSVADVIAGIPMRGGVDSLNVAAAAAVACWEVTRRRGLHPPPPG